MAELEQFTWVRDRVTLERPVFFVQRSFTAMRACFVQRGRRHDHSTQKPSRRHTLQIFGLSVVFAFLTAVGIGANDMVCCSREDAIILSS